MLKLVLLIVAAQLTIEIQSQSTCPLVNIFNKANGLNFYDRSTPGVPLEKCNHIFSFYSYISTFFKFLSESH
jgi:hypothetical protein